MTVTDHKVLQSPERVPVDSLIVIILLFTYFLQKNMYTSNYFLLNIQGLRGMMEERRINKTDRRQRTEKLPVRDAEGANIILERRYFPDRRKSHYNPNW